MVSWSQGRASWLKGLVKKAARFMATRKQQEQGESPRERGQEPDSVPKLTSPWLTSRRVFS